MQVAVAAHPRPLGHSSMPLRSSAVAPRPCGKAEAREEGWQQQGAAGGQTSRQSLHFVHAVPPPSARHLDGMG